MTLLEYSRTEFSNDLSKLRFTHPNKHQALNNTLTYIKTSTKFFGGIRWDNVENDLANIALENRKYFCLCLFILVSIDENMYTHFRENYDAFYKRTKYPKFGWLGLGPHIEKPCYLLQAPKNIDYQNIPESQINEFIHDLFQNSVSILGQISVKIFFTTLVNDPDFECEIQIFKMIKKSIKSELEVHN